MTKLISILFLSIYLFSVVQVNELFKIPIVFEHYEEHQQVEPKISVWKFICIHYMYGDVYDNDYRMDMKLPFKSDSANSLYSFVFCFLNQNYTLSSKFILIEYKKQNFKYAFSFISSYLSFIWQPPQIN